jgi:hypothetical protein
MPMFRKIREHCSDFICTARGTVQNSVSGFLDKSDELTLERILATDAF